MFKTPQKPAAPAKKAIAKKAAAPVTKGIFKKPAPSKRRDDDEEEIDGDGASGDDGITSGWGGAKKMAAEHSGFANRLQMKEEVIVVRFGNDTGPYANVATHWLEKKGKKSYICLGSATCPLCAIGDKPRVTYCYNVIQLTDGDPMVWSFEQGIKTHRKIEKLAQGPERYRPLTKMFYELERSGLKQDDTDYTFRVIKKTADIADDYPDLMIPTEAQIRKLKLYTKEDAAKGKPSMKEMRELVASITGDDADEDED